MPLSQKPYSFVIALLISSTVLQLNGQESGASVLSMQGGRAYFELSTGLQQFEPRSSRQWSFRIGGGAESMFGSFYAAAKYSIAGVRHAGEIDIPQTLVTFLRVGGGTAFLNRSGNLIIIPSVSIGHVSDRIIPPSGRSLYIFDGWGATPGLECRYILKNTFKPGRSSRSTSDWIVHFIQIEFYRAFTMREYTSAILSYNLYFDGYQLRMFGEYNSLRESARGWLVGFELGLGWLTFTQR